MITATIMRRVTLAGVLTLTSGCDLLLGIPNLGDADNVAIMTTRFKATIRAEDRHPTPLDWGLADRHIWRHYMGPRAVTFCGRPVEAPATQRAYQINFYRGSFGSIEELEVETPSHPPQAPIGDFCGHDPTDPPGPAHP